MSDSPTQNVYDRGDLSFIMVAGAMVFFMVPGLAFLYSGLSRRKNALSMIWAVAAANGVVVFQWYFWGYTLAFSTTADNGFIGNLSNIGLRHVMDNPSPGSPLVPDILYSFFQMEFGCVTAAILMGGLAERGRVLPGMVFIFLWMTLVYCPLACWVWASHGWAFEWGVMDFAGGGPVEIGSGVGGLAFSWVLGRRGERQLINFRPHNVALVYLGTAMLWFGWIGFNGGSAFGANIRAIVAIWNTMIAGALAGLVWCALDFRYERRWSMVGLCSGSIAGLVAATPSSGYVHPWGSVVIGILAGAICNFATKVKYLIRIDDALDLFAEHAVGGIVGLIMNAFFGSTNIIAMDGVNVGIEAGWVDKNWKALYKQVAYVAATCAYTFVVTALIAKGVDMVPGLKLRTSPEGEIIGIDETDIGEFASDYIELRREVHDPFGSSSKLVAAGDRHGVNDLELGKHTHNGNGAAPPPLEAVNEKPESGVPPST
ncbi:hypothetical protein MD484_g1100, partial [Candolleomyces efflorescens]